MKYKFYGRKIECVGKPLWEIVGNLKNFGVGRLIIESDLQKYPEPSFFKIIKVQPLQRPKDQFEDRNVIVWKEEVRRGIVIKETVKSTKNFMPNYMLIPKSEEEKYLKIAKDCLKNPHYHVVPKYQTWPPLFKLLWESRNVNDKIKSIPKLERVYEESEKYRIKIGDTSEALPSSNLYRLETSVEDMIKEIVKLQKIVNAHSAQDLEK